MPALNFKKQFAGNVRSGKKRQTIRADRKRPFVKGDKIYLYTGMRTKYCVLIGDRWVKNVSQIKILKDHTVLVNGKKYSARAIKNLAMSDGFSDVSDFYGFFSDTHGLPFRGSIIYW